MADIDHQPHKDLSNEEAIEKIKQLGKDANICIFHTALNNFPHHASPMALQDVCEMGNLYFISSTENHLNKNIEQDPRVVLSFSNSSKWEYMTVFGNAKVSKDKALIHKYYNKFSDAWFDGEDDPRVTVVIVTPVEGHYWETKNGKIVSALKTVFSAVTGAKTDDGGVDGELKL